MWTRIGGVLVVGLLICAGCAPVDPDDMPGEEPRPTVTLPMPEREPVVSKTASPLQLRIEGAITNVKQRSLMRTNAFWTIFHGILGLGPSVQLVDPRNGKQVNALDYICDGGELRGLAFQPTPHGVEVLTLRDSQGQGHVDQFIAEMAQWSMPANKKMRVQGRDVMFLDFVRQAQMRVQMGPDKEYSWTIIVVAQYLGTDAVWNNERGERVRLEDLVRYELDASIEKAACGGTHRLFGLTWVYHLHLSRGGKTEGIWKDVADKTARYREKARSLQNGDGTFSTRSFEGRGHDNDRQLRINTTGHILEWLALSLPDEELKAEWVENAANALSVQILELKGSPIDSGSMYHAVHGLYLYHARRYGGTFAPTQLKIPLPPGWRNRSGR